MNFVALETLLDKLFVSLSECGKAQVVVIRRIGFLKDNNPIRRLHVLELLLANELNDVTITFSVNLTLR